MQPEHTANLEFLSRFIASHRTAILSVYPHYYKEDAQDAFQDICEAFIREPSKLDGLETVNLYKIFYVAMKRRLINLVRARNNHHAVDVLRLDFESYDADLADLEHLRNPESAYGSVDQAIYARERAKQILTEREYRVLQMHLEGSINAYIGAHFGITRQAAEKTLNRAKAKLLEIRQEME